MDDFVTVAAPLSADGERVRHHVPAAGARRAHRRDPPRARLRRGRDRGVCGRAASSTPAGQGGAVEVALERAAEHALEPLRDRDERVDVDARRDAFALEQPDEILRRDVARRARRERAAAEAADRRVEDGRARFERGEAVRVARVARVVAVEAGRAASARRARAPPTASRRRSCPRGRPRRGRRTARRAPRRRPDRPRPRTDSRTRTRSSRSRASPPPPRGSPPSARPPRRASRCRSAR